MEKQENFLLEGNIWKILIKFSFPFLSAMLLQTLYGAADLIIVGRFSATSEVSGVAVGSQIMSLVTTIIVGFTSGITVLLGKYIGAGNKKKLRRLTGNSITLFFISALIIIIGIFIFSDEIIYLMHTPKEAEEGVRKYLFVCNICVFFIAGYNVVREILMGLGDSKTPLYCVVVACFFNIAADIILVKYFHLGALGAATATSFSQGISFLFSLFYLYKKGIGFKFGKKDIKFFKKEIFDIFKIGTPLAVQNCLILFSFLAVTAITNSMGITASASVGIVEKIMEFLPMPSFAISTAVSVIVAQNYGAGKFARTKKCLYAGMTITFIISLAACVLCQFYPQKLAGFFSKDADVIESTSLYLKSYSLDCIVLSFVSSFNGFFIGYGKADFTMFHSVITSFFIRIPIVYFLCFHVRSSLYEIGFASPLSTFLSLIICLFYWKYFKIPKEKI